MAATSYSNQKLLSILKHHSLSRFLQSYWKPILIKPQMYHSNKRLHHQQPMRSIFTKLPAPCPRYHSNTSNHHPMRRSHSFSQTKPLFLHVINQNYSDKIAIVDNHGQHSYETIIGHSTALSPYIIANATGVRNELGSETLPKSTLKGERIAFLCPNNASYIIAQWAIWMAGGVAVPLCKDHPSAELEYVIEDSQSSLLISTLLYEQRIQGIADKFNIKHLVLNENALSTQHTSQHSSNLRDELALPLILHSHCTNSLELDVLDEPVLRDIWNETDWGCRNAMLLYTSGTTGRPKGVVTTFGGYQTQVAMMLSAWEWTSKDIVLHTLPLHHFHGIVPLLACPLWSGATCVMMNKFDAEKVWKFLMSNTEPRINVFMAVPTIYAKLIACYNTKYEKSSTQVKAFIKASLMERVRLMVSGSSSLPQPVMEEWEQITGHRLLERYGMTEFGIAISNPLNGQRVPGAVGTPMPYVQARIVDVNGDVLVEGDSTGSKVKKDCTVYEGELQVKGPAVFKEYWNKPVATAETFTDDGWFKTGDTAKYEDGVYRIMGRTSVDIIKSGGYKISALDVERHLLSHPLIEECAVVGIPDLTWGQQVAAIVTLKSGSDLTLAELRDWSRDKMASYVIPTELKVIYRIPRNAMGKVNKKQLMSQVFEDQTPINPTYERLNSVVTSMKTSEE